MARVMMVNDVTETSVDEEMSFDQLVKAYVENKLEADSYGDLCSQQGAIIKEKLADMEQHSVTCGNYKLTRVEMEKSSFNQDKLLPILKEYNVPGVVKTVEVVDFDALESYLYKHMYDSDFPADLSAKIAECKNTATVVQLRMTKNKNKEA